MDDTAESLTLNDAARERATEALSEALGRGYTRHFCAEWQEDGACRICWDIAAEVIRATEGLQFCSSCRGGGLAAPAACCAECGGNGLEALAAE